MTFKLSLFSGMPPSIGDDAADANGYARKHLAEWVVEAAKPTKFLKMFGQTPGEGMDLAMKQLFALYEATNGFVVEVEGGGVAVGKTVSEACDAAQILLAQQKLQGDDAPKTKRAHVEKFKWR